MLCRVCTNQVKACCWVLQRAGLHEPCQIEMHPYHSFVQWSCQSPHVQKQQLGTFTKTFRSICVVFLKWNINDNAKHMPAAYENNPQSSAHQSRHQHHQSVTIKAAGSYHTTRMPLHTSSFLEFVHGWTCILGFAFSIPGQCFNGSLQPQETLLGSKSVWGTKETSPISAPFLCSQICWKVIEVDRMVSSCSPEISVRVQTDIQNNASSCNCMNTQTKLSITLTSNGHHHHIWASIVSLCAPSWAMQTLRLLFDDLQQSISRSHMLNIFAPAAAAWGQLHIVVKCSDAGDYDGCIFGGSCPATFNLAYIFQLCLHHTLLITASII